MKIDNLFESLKTTVGCQSTLATGLPQLPAGLNLPDDLRIFYEKCGGAELFLDQDFGFRIVGPAEFLRVNIVIFGEEYYHRRQKTLESDPTNSWYIIARGTGPEENISIDLAADHLGRCYDSFADVHGTGNSRIIALSFTELLERLLSSGGKRLFWEVPGFTNYGTPR